MGQKKKYVLVNDSPKYEEVEVKDSGGRKDAGWEVGRGRGVKVYVMFVIASHPRSEARRAVLEL